MSSRREFLMGMSSAALVSVTLPRMLLSRSESPRIPIAFSTLGCPAWDWKKILEFARQHGFAAIELRGLEGNLDLPSHPIFAADRLAQTKKEISASGLRIACVSSSANLYFEDPAKRAKELADARRFIDLAAVLGAGCVRVFGGKAEADKNPVPSDETKARVAAGLRELGTYAGPHGVTVIIESHDHFTSSATLKDVMNAAGSEHVGLLWDAHHTFATSNEDPEFTVKQLGPWIRHTHLKDSTGSGESRKYVLTGRGNVPIQRQIEALQKIGYKGFYCFEWEKVWHPDLVDPEIAIADYARVVGQCLGNAQACEN
ncbi:MAG TPA: sugar phosphate isomerase/epimerase family protein [Candidatus Dormibacteraeota bacterium]|nr:sugar phosphate isomerase/epimerase family protein [Candidatus Dormibacteraeota bacterium]